VHRVEYSNFSAPCGTVLSNVISHCERAHKAVNTAVFKRARRKRNRMFDIINSLSSEIKDHSQKHGYALKDVHLRAIESVLSSKDTIVVAKTGYGKSLIFQVAISLINSTGVGTAVMQASAELLDLCQKTNRARWSILHIYQAS
jgi:superfamily II DNA or RNA helicase